MQLTDDLLARLLAAGQIPPARVPMLQKECRDDVFEFVRMATQHGWLERDVAGRVVGDAIQCTYLNLETTLFQPDVVALLPRESAERYKAIPVYQFGPAVTVAMTNPQDTRIVQALSRLLRHPVDPLLSLPDEIESAIRVHYQSSETVDHLALTVDFELLASLQDEKLAELAPVIQLTIITGEKVSQYHR